MTASKKHPDKVQKELDHLNRFVDGLGMPVDTGIKLLVAELRCLGFVTIASCEGHLDRPKTEGPWIDIESNLARELKPTLWWKLNPDHPEYKEKQAAITLANLRERVRILSLLEEFYGINKDVPLSRRFVIKGLASGRSRLERQDTQIARLPERVSEYEQWLHDALAEVSTFADFLSTKIQ